MSGTRLVTQHARLEHTHAVADLFAALPRGDRPRRVVTVASSTGAHETWRFTLPFALDATDQSVLLVVLALTTQDEYARAIAPDGAARALSLAGEVAGASTMGVHTTEYRLARECGLAHGGSGAQSVRDAVDRLATATFDIQRDGMTVSGGALIARARAPDGRLLIAVNPYLARALLDPDSILWVKVDLEERRSLASETARLLHAWLSAWLRPGSSGRIRLDTLARHVWPPAPSRKTPHSTLRRRRHVVRQALDEIAALPGWKVTPTDDRNAVHVARATDVDQPRRQGSPTAAD